MSLLDDECTARDADLRARRGDVLRSLSRDNEAVQEHERALKVFDSLGDHPRFVETCGALQIIHIWASQFEEVKAVVERAAQYAKDAPASMQCSVLAMQANTAGAAGEIDKALDLLEELHNHGCRFDH